MTNPTAVTGRIARFVGTSIGSMMAAALLAGPLAASAAPNGADGETATFETLHHFARKRLPGDPFRDGSMPSGLTLGADGLAYGTTSDGGRDYNGVLFRIEADRSITLLYSYAYKTGRAPGELTLGADGRLYGTAPMGGPAFGGTVYAWSAANGYQILRSFSLNEPGRATGGDYPNGRLAAGSDGSIYGVTMYGGTFDKGVAFRISQGGAYTVLHHFGQTPLSAEYPDGGLLLAPDGFLYGTTDSGGPFDQGTVYRMATDGSGFEVIFDFRSEQPSPQTPTGSLIMDAAGNLYGSAAFGGAFGRGAVYRLSPARELTTLHSFNGTDGDRPNSTLTLGADKRLYGTTAGGGAMGGWGTAFEIKPDGSKFRVLHSFDIDVDGATPRGGLVRMPDGWLYGVTQTNGGTGSWGTVYTMQRK